MTISSSNIFGCSWRNHIRYKYKVNVLPALIYQSCGSIVENDLFTPLSHHVPVFLISWHYFARDMIYLVSNITWPRVAIQICNIFYFSQRERFLCNEEVTARAGSKKYTTMAKLRTAWKKPNEKNYKNTCSIFQRKVTSRRIISEPVIKSFIFCKYFLKPSSFRTLWIFYCRDSAWDSTFVLREF